MDKGNEGEKEDKVHEKRRQETGQGTLRSELGILMR
jgi:hypothetical protein